MSDLPAAASSPPQITRGVVAATVAGNALEFYDFVTYAFFAVYIGKAFFPLPTPFMSLLTSIAVFGVGFLFRPLGGILIGAYADRAGRKPAMLLTIGLITVGTLGLALVPSYATIGMAAPVLVVICRLVQGLALGGEVGPATAFLVEIAPPHRRGLYSSWQLASQGASATVAGLIGLLLSLLLSQDQMTAFGWRIPFIIGLALLPVALYLRRSMPETMHAAPAGSAAPRRLAGQGRLLVLATLIVIGGTVSTYVGQYMTTFAITALKLPPSIALSATFVGGASTFAFALIGGWMADRFGRRSIMLWPRVLTAVLIVPLFSLLIAAPGAGTLLGVSAMLAILTAVSGAASLVIISELLPAAARATGFSIAYAVGVSLFGGTTQFVITWLIQATGNPAAPAWYVVGTSILTIGAMLALPETKGRAID